MSERKILPVKSDVIFRMFFADERNVDLLAGFLKSVLRRPEDEYSEIVIITDEDLIQDSPNYHHRFVFYDSDADVEFSDIIEIHTLELRKLPESDDGTELYDWKAGAIPQLLSVA